jgi:hypothetical protein
LTWPEKARDAAVTDAAGYQRASELLLGIKAMRKRIAEVFDPHIARAFEAHRALTREKREAEAPLTEAEDIVKRALVAFDQEQERLRREQQRQAEAEARERAETEALERAAALETEGKAWGDDGLVKEAEQIIEEQIQAPTPAIAPIAKATPKVAGITMRTEWTCQLDSLPALIKFVAANPQFSHLLTFNQSAGTQLARAQRGYAVPACRAGARVAAGGK